LPPLETAVRQLNKLAPDVRGDPPVLTLERRAPTSAA
jgi:hypothetical protein